MSDGSLIFDTGIDLSGFIRDEKSLRERINRSSAQMQQSLAALGDALTVHAGRRLADAIDLSACAGAGREAAYAMVDADAYAQAGRENAKSYISGLRKAVRDLCVSAPEGALQGGQALPGHATGLNYVPYNDYLARLHVGEAVLNAADARQWRAQKAAGGVSAADIAAIVSAATAADSAPAVLVLDGKVVAEVQAGNNRSAIGGKSRKIALGVGLK